MSGAGAAKQACTRAGRLSLGIATLGVLAACAHEPDDPAAPATSAVTSDIAAGREASAGGGAASAPGTGDAERASNGMKEPSADGDARRAPDASSGSTDDAGAPARRQLSLENAMQSYLGWTKRTAEPQSIKAQIFSLCRFPSLPERSFVESEHG